MIFLWYFFVFTLHVSVQSQTVNFTLPICNAADQPVAILFLSFSATSSQQLLRITAVSSVQLRATHATHTSCASNTSLYEGLMFQRNHSWMCSWMFHLPILIQGSSRFLLSYSAQRHSVAQDHYDNINATDCNSCKSLILQNLSCKTYHDDSVRNLSYDDSVHCTVPGP